MNMIEEDKVLLVTNRVANVTNLPMNDTWNTRVIGTEQDIHPVLGRLKYLLKNNRMNEIEMNERDKIERLYRCKITELQLNDNLLCVQRTSPNRVVILLPENRIATALSVGHSSPTAGHGGVRATLDRLNKLCYWPEMNKDVKEYVRECEVCQRFKPATEQAAPLRSYPPAEWPFARVHMDLIGPLNASQDGYKYILTCVDACTRYLVAVALRTKNAEEVVEAFTTNFICQHGVPCWLVTDNGSEFINEKFKGLAEAVGLKHTQVTAYHPSANGLVERANKTIVSILRTLTEDNPHMWSKMLGYATLAYNTATNRTLGETPYFCLYLKDPKLPYDILGKPFSPSYNIDSTKEQVQRMMQACYARCQEKTEESQAYERTRRESKSRIKPIQMGDKVYTKNIPKTGVAKKLQPKYSGPWRVINKVSDVVVVLKNLKTGREIKIHTDRVKIMHENTLTSTDNANVGKVYPVHESDTDCVEMNEEMNKISIEVEDSVREECQ